MNFYTSTSANTSTYTMTVTAGTAWYPQGSCDFYQGGTAANWPPVVAQLMPNVIAPPEPQSRVWFCEYCGSANDEIEHLDCRKCGAPMSRRGR
jgi:hypothetical protein